MKGESGQTIVEYILVSGVIVIAILALFQLFRDREYFFNELTSPAVYYLKFNYKYGHRDALGWDEVDLGGPRKNILQTTGTADSRNFHLYKPSDK